MEENVATTDDDAAEGSEPSASLELLKSLNHAQASALARIKDAAKPAGRYVMILREDWDDAFEELRNRNVVRD